MARPPPTSLMKIHHLLRCAAATLLLAVAARASSLDSIPDVAAKFDVPPRPLKAKPPVYPAHLRKEGISGAVIIALVLDQDGKVIAAEATKATHEEFREPALKAVRDWTFSPAQVAGKAVRARVNIPLNFSAET
jgi:protein TonB